MLRLDGEEGGGVTLSDQSMNIKKKIKQNTSTDQILRKQKPLCLVSAGVFSLEKFEPEDFIKIQFKEFS